MGNVIHVDFGQTNPPCPPDQYADVISIVGELEPAHAFAVLSNALFAVLLAKNARSQSAMARPCASSIDQYVNCSWHRKG